MATDLNESIKSFLLLDKPEKTARNVLAMLGLFAKDFTDDGNVRIIFDAEDITVEAKALDDECTCDPKDPRTVAIPGDSARHSTRCHHSMAYVLSENRNLVDIDADDNETVYTFQWPRNIDAHRFIIATAFPEVQDDQKWKSFKMSWNLLTNQMGDLRTPLRDADKGSEEVLVPQDVPSEGMDFAEEGLEFGDDFGGNPLVVDAADTPNSPDDGPDLLEWKPTDKADAPIQEAKRGRGRPKGSTKQAKEQAKELGAEDFQAIPGKPIPALQKFMQFFVTEVGLICDMVETISTAEKFPFETVETVKTGLDRLALRTAHLLYRGQHDADAPGCLNPMIEVTLANITAQSNAAIRDLSLAAEKPASWEAYGKAMKEALDTAKDMTGVISQAGMGPVITEAPREGDGRSIG